MFSAFHMDMHELIPAHTLSSTTFKTLVNITTQRRGEMRVAEKNLVCSTPFLASSNHKSLKATNFQISQIIFFLNTWPFYVAQADLKCTILLPRCPKH